MPDKYVYRFTPLAVSDMDEALAYITDKLVNAKAAGDLLDKIERTLDSVCVYPHAFPDCTAFLISDPMIRHTLVGNYVLVYEIHDEERKIAVLRFRYARTNLSDTPMKKDDK